MIIKKQIKYLVDINNQKAIKEIKLNISQQNSMYIIHRALIQQLNNKRQGTANTKTRSEVQGGGKKPWKQKGTGKARSGSIRSPLWKGGGVIFGPKNRNYHIKLNKKEKQIALTTLLYNKFKQTIITDNSLERLNKTSTKFTLKKIQQLVLNTNTSLKILIIVKDKNQNLYLSTKNLKNVELITANQLNIISLLKAKKILISLSALDTINKVYNVQNK